MTLSEECILLIILDIILVMGFWGINYWGNGIVFVNIFGNMFIRIVIWVEGVLICLCLMEGTFLVCVIFVP